MGKHQPHQLGGRSYSNWPSSVGPQPLCNRTFLWCFCVVILPFWHICWCRGFCHMTESDLFLFLLWHSDKLMNKKLGFQNISFRNRIRSHFQSFKCTGVRKTKQQETRHVFVKHGWPWRQQSQNKAKISKSYILTPTHLQGHGMSVKCEGPIDELPAQVWLLHHHPNFGYCILIVSGTE